MSDNQLLSALKSPEALEHLYRRKPNQFRAWLDQASLEYPESETIKVWKARLNYAMPAKSDAHRSTLFLTIILSLLSLLLVKLPAIFSLSENWYYPRFAPLIIASALVAYFYRRIDSNNVKLTIIGGLAFCTLISAALPHDIRSASVAMSQIHMPLLLGSLLALAFMARGWKTPENRLLYIRYIGEMIIYSTLLLIGGIVLAMLTLGLFKLIGLSIENWYFNYVVVLGLVATPLVATYLYDSVLGRDSKLATIIANVFSPLFLITITIYLLAVLYQGKSPYSDRDFLVTFNGLLVVVWAITVFSVSGVAQSNVSKSSNIMNMALVSVTLLINAIALSAILFRLSEYGITPNRVAVTGANILIFTHLIVILNEYIKYARARSGQDQLTTVVAKYLPIYSGWALFVVVVLPVTFGFK